MVFSILDQGIRTNTPLYDIFPSRGVDKTSSITPSATLDPKNTLKESQFTSQPLKTYLQIGDKKAQQRHPIYQAKEIMTSPAISLHADASLAQAWQQFQLHRFRHIPITDRSNKLLGIISERDILSATSQLLHSPATNVGENTVASIMKTRVLTAEPDTEVRLLAEAITRYHIGAVPILDKQLILVGIITRSDIVRTIIRRAPLELWS